MPRIAGPEGFGDFTPSQPTTVGLASRPARADSLSQIAEIGAKIAGQLKANKIKVKETTATTSATNDLRVFINDLERDTDFDTQFERYQERVKELAAQQQKELGDSAANAGFRKNFGDFAFTEGLKVRSSSFEGQISVQRGELELNMRRITELAGSIDDADQREGVKDFGVDTLNESFSAGVINGEELATQIIQFEDDLVAGDVRRDIRNDPDNALIKLQANAYEGLTAEKQQIWRDRAVKQAESNTRQRLSEESRAEKAADNAEKVIQDVISKEGDTLLRAGDMSEEWIEDNIDVLSEEDRRYFYRALDSDSPQNVDISVYTNLRIAASTADVREEAREAVSRGTITLAQFDKLTSRSELNAAEVTLPNNFKRGEQYIARALQISDINPDPAKAQRLASAMDDWTQWVQDNRKASDEEFKSAYQRVTKEYAFLDFQDDTLTKRLPRFAVGNRQDLDIEASMAATVKRFNDGELSEEDFEDQARLLKEWEGSQQRYQQAEAP